MSCSSMSIVLMSLYLLSLPSSTFLIVVANSSTHVLREVDCPELMMLMSMMPVSGSVAAVRVAVYINCLASSTSSAVT